MQKHTFIFSLIFVFGAFFFCTNKKQKNEKKIAQVLDSVLYKKDINPFIYKGFSKKDSIQAIKNYVEKWAKRQLLLHKAHINLVAKNKTIEKLVKKYEEDLKINFYKQALLQKQLDTTITAQQIKSYYNTYKENFKTYQRLVKYKYIVLDKDDPKKKKWLQLINSGGKANLKALAKVAKIFKSAYLKDSIWVTYEDFLKKVPILKKEDAIYSGKFFNHTDDNALHYVKIIRVLPKGAIAPVGYVFPVITKIILHKRKLAFLKKVADILLDDAKRTKKFEFYEN